MDEKTKAFVKSLVAWYNGDQEKTAIFMRDSLHIKGIKSCRELIAEAMQ